MAAEPLMQPDESLRKPLEIPSNRLLLGPGPANPNPRVLRASSLPLIGHLHPEFLKVMSDITAGLQYLFQTTNTLTLAISGTGHAGMEASFVNLVEEGEKVMILKTGIWGDRAKEIAERCGAVVKTLENPPGEVFKLFEIEQGLTAFKPAVLFVCQGESSTGTYQPLEDISTLCHTHGCLLVVDTVASLGGVPFYMDKWGIDVAYSGSQKVLGAPPGCAPISFSPQARLKMSKRKTPVRSFYFDLSWLERYWGVDGAKRVYHHTGPISNYYALREALALVVEEGLEACWKRHRENAETLWQGLEDMGLKLFIQDKAARLPTVTAVKVPYGIYWKNVTDYLMEKHNVEVSGGLGPTAGEAWRIGLMGYNCSPGNVQLLLKILAEALKHTERVKTRL